MTLLNQSLRKHLIGGGCSCKSKQKGGGLGLRSYEWMWCMVMRRGFFFHSGLCHWYKWITLLLGSSCFELFFIPDDILTGLGFCCLSCYSSYRIRRTTVLSLLHVVIYSFSLFFLGKLYILLLQNSFFFNTTFRYACYFIGKNSENEFISEAQIESIVKLFGLICCCCVIFRLPLRICYRRRFECWLLMKIMSYLEQFTFFQLPFFHFFSFVLPKMELVVIIKIYEPF